MMCEPCREAGILNADAQRVYDSASKVYLEHRAQEKHGECDIRDCNCEHKTGQWLSNVRHSTSNRH